MEGSLGFRKGTVSFHFAAISRQPNETSGGFISLNGWASLKKHPQEVGFGRYPPPWAGGCLPNQPQWESVGFGIGIGLKSVQKEIVLPFWSLGIIILPYWHKKVTKAII